MEINSVDKYIPSLSLLIYLMPKLELTANGGLMINIIIQNLPSNILLLQIFAMNFLVWL